MAIELEKYLRKKNLEPDNGTVTMYLDKNVWKEFKKLCEPRAPGEVLEPLIVDMMKEAQNPGVKAADLTPARRELLDVLAAVDESQIRSITLLIESRLEADTLAATQKRGKKA